MKLKSMIKTDFIPMVKTPKFWISPETLREGSLLVVESAIGHQLLAQYPAAFQVINYDDEPNPAPEKTRRRKQMQASDLSTGQDETFSVGVE